MNAISTGDINADNINDILIGSASGIFYIIFGRYGSYSDIDLTLKTFTSSRKGFKVSYIDIVDRWIINTDK